MKKPKVYKMKDVFKDKSKEPITGKEKLQKKNQLKSSNISNVKNKINKK